MGKMVTLTVIIIMRRLIKQVNDCSKGKLYPSLAINFLQSDVQSFVVAVVVVVVVMYLILFLT